MSGALEGVALVTGAASGMGRAIARLLAERGMRVVLSDRDADGLATTMAPLGAERAAVLLGDLSKEGEVATLAAHLRARFDRLHVLVHAAGIVHLGRLAEATAAELEELYAVNLRAPVLLTQALLPALRAARGQIVFINSSAAMAPGAINGLYAATKAALAAFAKSLREDVNPDGVRVLSVFPGRTATPLQERVHAFEGIAYRPERLLQPGDVATAVADLLALPASAEVTEVFIRPSRKPTGEEAKP